MRGHPLVEQAQATLCRLADAPPAADAAKAAIADIEGLWGKPLAVAIGGEVPARTELFNVACESNVFDPHTRALGSAAIRIKVGPTPGFRAFRNDGTQEEQAMPPDRAKDVEIARARGAAARGDVAEREGALERIDSALPKRPVWWQIWLWPMYWLLIWRSRRRLSEKKLAEQALGEAREQLKTFEDDAVAIEAHSRIARNRYFESLRNLASGGPIGAGIVEVEVTLASSLLPDGIEIVELSGASRASVEVDAVLLAQGDKIFAPTRGAPLAIGDHAHVLGALPALLADARALRIARRVQQRVTSAMATLADAIERKEATFRQRIERLRALRLPDPIAFAQTQLESVRSDISASVNAVVEHSSVHLGSELAQLQQEWIGWVANAANPDELKAAVAKIEEEWHARPRRIADEVRVLVMGGLGGSARDLYPAIVRELSSYGLPEEHARSLRAAPPLPAVVLLPSLTKETAKLDKGGWFTGLFRSFETKRTEIREKVHERVQRLREVAEAELLDAEPRLHHAIGTALAELLETAIAKQSEAVDAALDQERAAIETERDAIAPLIHVHDAVRSDANRLAEMIAQLERHQPGIAVAAAAAETASLSR